MTFFNGLVSADNQIAAIARDFKSYYEGGMADDGGGSYPAGFADASGSVPNGICQGYQTANKDFTHNSVTITTDRYAYTEGQSYLAMICVITGDEARFADVVSAWNDYFRRDSAVLFHNALANVSPWHTSPSYPDALAAYCAGRNTTGGAWGVAEPTVATDGDLLYTWALLLAYEKGWGTGAEYLDLALESCTDMIEKVVQESGDGYLWFCCSAGQHPSIASSLTLSANYNMPAAYRKFAQYDTGNAATWNQLLDDWYEYGADAIGALTTPGIPPNFNIVNRTTGAINFLVAPNDVSSQIFVSPFRIYWHMLEDWVLNREPRARAWLLAHPFPLEKADQGPLTYQYFSDGTPNTGILNGVTRTTAAAAMAYLAVAEPRRLPSFYAKWLAPQFTQTQVGGYCNFHYDYFPSGGVFFHTYWALRAVGVDCFEG